MHRKEKAWRRNSWQKGSIPTHIPASNEICCKGEEAVVNNEGRPIATVPLLSGKGVRWVIPTQEMELCIPTQEMELCILPEQRN